MSMIPCNSKECIHKNLFGYCMLTGYCEYPELRTYNTYDNQTEFRVSKDKELNHKCKSNESADYSFIATQEERDICKAIAFLDKYKGDL